jgi:hypothetical protein
MISLKDKTKTIASADLEKALASAESERAKAAAAHEAMTSERKNILMNADDAAAERHDAEIARHARARDRAELQVENLKGRLVEALAAEKKIKIAEIRAEAEKLAVTAVNALQGYEAIALKLRGIVDACIDADVAAAAFERRYPDEPGILWAETRARAVLGQEKQIISESSVELWVFTEGGRNGEIVSRGIAERIYPKPSNPNEGLLHSPSGNPAVHVEKRWFCRRTFLPATRGSIPTPLAYTVKLPALAAGDPAILSHEAGRQMAWRNPEMLAQGVQSGTVQPSEEYIPLSAPPVAKTEAA